MSQHWSDEQKTAWAMGERNVEMAEHLATCDACRHELAQVQESLAAFRGEVHEAASRDEFRSTRIRHAVASRAVERSHGLRWAFTTALALMALSVGLLVSPHKKVVHQPVQKVEMSDEQLLNEINDDLSRSAPEALAPVESLQQERASLLAQANSQGTQQTDRRQ